MSALVAPVCDWHVLRDNLGFAWMVSANLLMMLSAAGVAGNHTKRAHTAIQKKIYYNLLYTSYFFKLNIVK